MADRRTRRQARRQPAEAARTAAAVDRHAGVPAWAAPVVYAVVTAVLFREVIFSGALLLGQDTFALSYFARNFYTSFVNTMGRFPLWNPLLFGGIPFVDGMHGDIFYPPSLALFFLDAKTMWGWKMLLHVYAAGIFAYIWLRGMRIGRGAALFGGLVYMMGADLVSLVYPGGDGKLFVSALAPLVFWLADRCVRNRRLADFAAFALGLALVIYTSHMQLAYFTVWGVSLYFFFRLWQAWRAERKGGAVARLTGLFALAGLMGVGASTVQIVPPLQYLREWSHRAGKTLDAAEQSGYEYSTTWSLHPEEAMSLVVPEFVGDNVPGEIRSADRYWGRNAFKINHEYAGLLPLLLLPLLLVGRREARTWFFIGLGGMAVLYGLGATTPLFHLFYLIPGVSLFRAPSLIIFLYGMSVAALGAFAFQRIVDARAEPDGGASPAVRRALWIVAGVFLLLALAQSSNLVTNAWQSVFGLVPGRGPALQNDLEYIRRGFWIAFALAAATAGLWEAVVRGLLGVREAALVFALLAFVDLYRVDRPFIRGTVLVAESQAANNPAIFTPDETIRFLQERQASEDPFRVFDLGLLGVGQGPAYGPNVLAIHGIEQLTGHHGNEMLRYRDLMGGSDSAPNVATSQLRLLNLANVEYVLLTQRIADPAFEEVFVGSRAAIYRNLNALPRAWLAGTTEVVNDDDAVGRLLAADFDPRTNVLLPEPLPAGIEVQPDPQGTVTWGNREADRYTMSVETDRPALLVITENFYPAWKAEIDGAEVSLLRADYTFRAVPVPAGRHEVRLYYDSSQLNDSAWASTAVLLLLAGIAATGMRKRHREPTVA